MKISSLLSAGGLFALTVASTASALPANPLTPPQHAVSCTKPRPIPNYNGTDFRNVGVLLFPGFDLIDVFGTIEPLQSLSLSTQQINLSMIARTLDPVSRGPDHPGIEKYRSAFSPAALPTHTFDDELDLDLLIVPGGNGVRKPDMPDEIAYIKRMFPQVKVLMTICTGSGLAARAGIMDGYMATTNKAAWQSILPMGPRVKWVSPARYVIDGKLWTSSGVSFLIRNQGIYL